MKEKNIDILFEVCHNWCMEKNRGLKDKEDCREMEIRDYAVGGVTYIDIGVDVVSPRAVTIVNGKKYGKILFNDKIRHLWISGDEGRRKGRMSGKYILDKLVAIGVMG